MRLLLTTLFLLFIGQSYAQVYYTRTGHINVRSENNLKSIEADNYQLISTIDFETQDVNFEGLLKSFEFKLGALDRVFNSSRINVNQYPKIKFEGRVKGIRRIDLSKKKRYEVEVKGKLYIWDEKRVTSAKGVLISDGKGGFRVESDFLMRIEEKSMDKLNQLIDQKLPEAINVSTQTFGVDRDIKIKLRADYTLRNW